MIFQSYTPGYPLQQFVERFFYYEGFAPEHTVDRFLPDGNVEIIIDLTDTPKYIYDNETLKEIQACHRVWASGVRTEFITIPSGKESAMFIIYFKKGRAYPFFPVPMYEMSDRVLDADLLWGDSFGRMRERLLEEKFIPHKFAIVEQFLLRKFHVQFEANPCVAYAVDAIVARPEATCLQALYDKIGYSQKHFIALFKEHVGLTPKAYLKILRFQKAIRGIEQQTQVHWGQIAHESGFYDQSHFIHDFKHFSGFTPEEYFAKKNQELNYVPVG